MTKKFGNLSIIGVYGILICVTLAVYLLLGLNVSEINRVAIAFVLLAEIASCAGIIGLTNNKSTTHVLNLSAGVTILSSYLFVSIGSALFSNYFSNNINIYILIQIVIIAVTLIIGIIFASLSRGLNGVNKESILIQNKFKDYELKLYNAAESTHNSSVKSELSQLYESLKYSDKNGISSVDPTLFELIDELELTLINNESLSISQLIQSILDCLNQRKQELLQLKRGGY